MSRSAPSAPGTNFAVTLSGHASPVRAGRVVQVERLSGGSWLLVGQAKESSSGAYSVRTSVAGSSTYRAVGLRWRNAGFVISPQQVVSVDDAPVVVPPVVVPQTATLTMPTALVRDQAGIATMKVTPVRAGRSVALQVLNNAGVWTTVAAGPQSSTGTASFPVNTGFAATFSYRVWTATAADTTAAVSAVHTLKVLPGDRLRAGEVLHNGDSLITPDGRYRLSMQADGNLVERVVATNRLLWSSLTAGHQGAWAVMQYDGNAVVYDGNGVALWQTRSNGTGAASSLVLQTDANLVNYNSGGHPVWVSSTKNDRLAPGEALTAGQWIRSVDGANTLLMQWDGNLVLCNRLGVALWSSRTNNHANAWAVSQGDGNFVVYQGSTALWNSKTGGQSSGGTVVVQNDTNLVLYRGGVATWHR